MIDSTAWPSATKCKHMRRFAGCPDCAARWDLDELDRLRTDNERLREALHELVNYDGPAPALGAHDKARAILASTTASADSAADPE